MTVVAEASWLPPGLRSAVQDPSRLAATDLADVLAFLRARGKRSLDELTDERLRTAWRSSIQAFRNPRSGERRDLDARLSAACALSRPCLEASLESLLAGFGDAETQAILQRSRPLRDGLPHLLVLAANVPGLVLQPLVACLALRRTVLVKTSSREPHFTPAFVAALARREPLVGEGIAVITWSGGDRQLEEVVSADVDRIVAYGDDSTLADLDERAGDKLVAFGSAASLAVLGSVEEQDLATVTRALARDVVLFEQRGCLSLQAIYIGAGGDGGSSDMAAALARSLAEALVDAAERWPPCEPAPAAAAAVRQARQEAAFLGCCVIELELPRGTIIVDPRPGFRPSPGLRTVRIHPISSLDALPAILAPVRGRLQGAVLIGSEARALRPALARLGVSRFCEPGQLQSPAATWNNGGVDLLTTLSRGRVSYRGDDSGTPRAPPSRPP